MYSKRVNTTGGFEQHEILGQSLKLTASYTSILIIILKVNDNEKYRNPYHGHYYYIIIIIISPLYRVFTIMYLKHTISLRYVLLHLFSSYSLCYMQCYFPCWMFLHFYISIFPSMCSVPNMADFCSSLISCFPGMLLRYFFEWLSDSSSCHCYCWYHFYFNIPHALYLYCTVFAFYTLFFFFHYHISVSWSRTGAYLGLGRLGSWLGR